MGGRGGEWLLEGLLLLAYGKDEGDGENADWEAPAQQGRRRHDAGKGFRSGGLADAWVSITLDEVGLSCVFQISSS